jgi:aldose 1-epimerase
MRTPILLALFAMVPTMLQAAELTETKDAQSGLTVLTAKAGRTQVKVVPEAGCNPYSIQFDGVELLRTPEALQDLPGFMYGNPLLYPTPNRVRGAKFTWQGKTYEFPDNNNGNFLHGLVHNARWLQRTTRMTNTPGHEEVGLNFALPFRDAAAVSPEELATHEKLFPWPHELRFQVQVTDAAVRFTYTVDNTQGKKALPFGFALHPWFLYQGKRAETYLQIPATHVMEAQNVLPTGRLLELAGSKFDCRQPRSLEGFVIDDVYFGLGPQHPVLIDFRDKKLQIAMASSADFTHLVVYTPEQPWFCVENQTCSTDAHNLHNQGLKRESHLQVLPPGKTHTGWVEFRFKKVSP